MAEFKCPLSQFVLADALGLTAIHVNRVPRQLRERGLLTLHKGLPSEREIPFTPVAMS
jgi:CRP-like cAMP-binding protein